MNMVFQGKILIMKKSSFSSAFNLLKKSEIHIIKTDWHILFYCKEYGELAHIEIVYYVYTSYQIVQNSCKLVQTLILSNKSLILPGQIYRRDIVIHSYKYFDQNDSFATHGQKCCECVTVPLLKGW